MQISRTDEPPDLARDAVRLRAMHYDIIRRQYEAQAAVAAAKAAVERYNEQELLVYARYLIAPGHRIDIWGDGTSKPERECAPMPGSSVG